MGCIHIHCKGEYVMGKGKTQQQAFAEAKQALEKMGEALFYQKYDVIFALNCCTRAKNCMINEKISTLFEIDNLSAKQLLRQSNFGKVALQDLRRSIEKFKTELGIGSVDAKYIKKAQESMRELAYFVGVERAKEIFNITMKSVLKEQVSEVLKSVSANELPFYPREEKRKKVDNLLTKWII